MDFNYIPTICPYCGTGCGMHLVVKEKKVVGVEPWSRHPINEGKYVPKETFTMKLFIEMID